MNKTRLVLELIADSRIWDPEEIVHQLSANVQMNAEIKQKILNKLNASKTTLRYVIEAFDLDIKSKVDFIESIINN